MKEFHRVFQSIIISVALTGLLQAQDYGWRGPERTGIYNESGLLKSWPEQGPKLLFEIKGFGPGYSSPSVTGDAIYITGVHGDKDVLTAYSQNGKKKWETEYGSMSKSNYPESRCTPTFYKGKLYVISGQGDLACISKDGKLLWTVPYHRTYQASVPRFGISESPLVVDDKVIATPGGNKAAMIAFSTETGKVIWETAPFNEGSQYVSPLLIEEKGGKYIVTMSSSYIYAVNAADGKVIWKFEWGSVNPDKRGGKNYIHTPVYKNGYLFAANGYKQVAVMLRVTFDSKAPELVWTNAEITPHTGAMVLIGDYIYSSTHDDNSKGRWICVDWNSGKTMWIQDWNNKGSIVSADGMLYLYEEKNGNVALVRPGSQKFDLVSSFQINQGSGPHWAHMVVDKGRLFVRHGDYMAVYSIKAK